MSLHSCLEGVGGLGGVNLDRCTKVTEMKIRTDVFIYLTSNTFEGFSGQL